MAPAQSDRTVSRVPNQSAADGKPGWLAQFRVEGAISLAYAARKQDCDQCKGGIPKFNLSHFIAERSVFAETSR